LGRPRVHGRNTPRTIDLDILYAGTVRLNLPELQIPHPRLALRRFVLAPLCDIQPDLCLPGFPQSVAVLLQNLNDPAGAQLCAHQWTT
jgi:2-amino-4-hydroxy-6-hydroxymethyldihydropteridine diphosphokinase